MFSATATLLCPFGVQTHIHSHTSSNLPSDEAEIGRVFQHDYPEGTLTVNNTSQHM